MSNSKKIVLTSVTVIGTLLVCMIAAEIALRIAGIGYGNAPLIADSILEYKHPSNYSYRMYTLDDNWGGFTIRYDDKGLRSDFAGQLIYDSGRHSRRIAFLGDSFVEGNQMPYAESIVGILNTKAKDDVFVFNFGVASYSPIVYNLQWRSQVVELEPVHLFVLLFSNDIEGDQRRERLAQDASTITEDGIVSAVPSRGSDWLRRFLRHLYVARLFRKAYLQVEWFWREKRSDIEGVVGNILEQNPNISDVTDRHLRALITQIRDSGGDITLLAVPSQYRFISDGAAPNGPSFAEKVGQWAKINGVDYVNLDDVFSRYRQSTKDDVPSPFFDNDIHFNEIGAKLVADAIIARFSRYFGRRPQPQ